MSKATGGMGLNKMASRIPFNLKVLEVSREDRENCGTWRIKKGKSWPVSSPGQRLSGEMANRVRSRQRASGWKKMRKEMLQLTQKTSPVLPSAARAGQSKTAQPPPPRATILLGQREQMTTLSSEACGEV